MEDGQKSGVNMEQQCGSENIWEVEGRRASCIDRATWVVVILDQGLSWHALFCDVLLRDL